MRNTPVFLSPPGVVGVFSVIGQRRELQAAGGAVVVSLSMCTITTSRGGPPGSQGLPGAPRASGPQPPPPGRAAPAPGTLKRVQTPRRQCVYLSVGAASAVPLRPQPLLDCGRRGTAAGSPEVTRGHLRSPGSEEVGGRSHTRHSVGAGSARTSGVSIVPAVSALTALFWIRRRATESASASVGVLRGIARVSLCVECVVPPPTPLGRGSHLRFVARVDRSQRRARCDRCSSAV